MDQKYLWIEALKFNDRGLIPAIARIRSRWYHFNDGLDEQRVDRADSRYR